MIGSIGQHILNNHYYFDYSIGKLGTIKSNMGNYIWDITTIKHKEIPSLHIKNMEADSLIIKMTNLSEESLKLIFNKFNNLDNSSIQNC